MIPQYQEIELPIPNDPFLFCLVRLSQIMSRSAEEIYGKPHGSFLSMEKAATSIYHDLHHFESIMQHHLGFGIEHEPPSQEQGVCQTILTSCTSLVAFPFLLVLL